MQIHMLVTDLIKNIPGDAQNKVEKVKKNYNKLIRDAIRFELKLSLNFVQ